jgi:hypothetical protein
LKGRPRNRWQNEAREDRRIVGGEGWHEKLYDREDVKKLLRMAWIHHILHMPNGMNDLHNLVPFTWFT